MSTTTIDQIRDLEEKISSLREELDELVKEKAPLNKLLFEEKCKALFEKYPKLESFSWRQYTPSFNDGDPCYFRVLRDYITGVYDGEEYEEFYFVEKDEEIEDLWDNFDVLKPFSDDELQEMFGNYAEIEVTRNEVSVSGYYC